MPIVGWEGNGGGDKGYKDRKGNKDRKQRAFLCQGPMMESTHNDGVSWTEECD